MSINREIDKEDVVHIYNRILLSHKNEWNNGIYSNMDVVTVMDLEIIILSEVSQTVKDKHHIISYMWILEKGYKWTYLQNRNRLTDFENKVMITKGDRCGLMVCGLEIGIYILCMWNDWLVGPWCLAQGILPSVCDGLCGKRIWKRIDCIHV